MLGMNRYRSMILFQGSVGPLPEATLTESDRQIWSDLVGFGRIRSDSVGFGRIFGKFGQFGQTLLHLVGFGLILIFG